MVDLAKAADLGAGPYGVELDAEDGFYWITRDGERVRSYPLGKTAYRECRKMNAATPGIVVGLDLRGTAEEVAERYQDPAPRVITKASRDIPGKLEEETKRAAAEIAKSKAPRAKRAPKVKHGAAATPSVTASFQGTREEWLNAFTAAARPVFAEKGHPLPDKVRVSIGFTGSRGGGKVLGACWHEEASTDGAREIFVVPTLDDSSLIAGVLTHELCHTLFGPDEKHGKNFRKAGAAVGLIGKATSMLPPQDGSKNEWHEWADPILADLGPIPHAKLDPTKSGVKKQTTRLVKAECETCGFIVRTTAKWVNSLSERGLDLECPDPECFNADEMRSKMCVGVPEGEGE